MRKILLALIVLNLAACAVVPTKEQVAKAKFGEKPDSEMTREAIEDSLKKYYVEPDALEIDCAEARKGWAKELVDAPFRFGWVVYCQVSPKDQEIRKKGGKPIVYVFEGNSLKMTNPYGVAREGREYGYLE